MHYWKNIFFKFTFLKRCVSCTIYQDAGIIIKLGKDLNKTDKTGANTIAAITTKALSIKDWSIFTLTNNLIYGPLIEFGGYPTPVMLGTYNKSTKSYEVLSDGGYSKQAPQGVLRTNIKRFNMILEAQARKNLPK